MNDTPAGKAVFGRQPLSLDRICDVAFGRATAVLDGDPGYRKQLDSSRASPASTSQGRSSRHKAPRAARRASADAAARVLGSAGSWAVGCARFSAIRK